MKKAIVTFLKIGISGAILGYLLWDAHRNAAFAQMCRQPKRWGILACALAACGAAVLLALIRWCYLVRALGVRVRLRDALRLGFLGYLFNLAPMGILGGDVLRAVMLTRLHNGHGAKSFASVIVDRTIGLYMLFVVASSAIFLTGFTGPPGSPLAWVVRGTFLVTSVATLGVIWVLAPDLSRGRWKPWLARVRFVGRPLLQLVEAMEVYRSRRPQLLVSAGMTVGVHALFALGVFLIARGLYDDVPSLGAHMVINPLAVSAGVIPLPAGPYELVLEQLYRVVPAASGGATHPGQGLVIALAYRIISLLIATVGIGYYLAGGREVRRAAQQPPADEEAVGRAAMW